MPSRFFVAFPKVDLFQRPMDGPMDEAIYRLQVQLQFWHEAIHLSLQALKELLSWSLQLQGLAAKATSRQIGDSLRLFLDQEFQRIKQQMACLVDGCGGTQSPGCQLMGYALLLGEIPLVVREGSMLRPSAYPLNLCSGFGFENYGYLPIDPKHVHKEVEIIASHGRKITLQGDLSTATLAYVGDTLVVNASTFYRIEAYEPLTKTITLECPPDALQNNVGVIVSHTCNTHIHSKSKSMPMASWLWGADNYRELPLHGPLPFIPLIKDSDRDGFTISEQIVRRSRYLFDLEFGHLRHVHHAQRMLMQAQYLQKQLERLIACYEESLFHLRSTFLFQQITQGIHLELSALDTMLSKISSLSPL